ncbi:tRNA(adenine34) deaminase [Filimonas zeae]|uniref:tRNA-specific adenosine deaminase n=1 Tax=Filimonas zeae TaxID=1737353 RepID=A0A917IYS7_9BACT|nr:nucleoside deaminase [Filimonas zeae]MDR6340065.1 tRNA(adenine34) deaminase [Filimonas zeae]GGH70969.1 tRNA-specific adenosine deaminase [Filimonas zeae]
MVVENDEMWMKRCLELASIAKERGKTAVGAVVIKDNEVIAEGIESSEEYPALVAHAEIIALIKATEVLGTKELSGCQMYTSVEPCFMCAYLLRETKIAEVIFGARAGQIGATNPDLPLLTTDKIARWPVQIKVRGGVLEEACMAMLKRKQA